MVYMNLSGSIMLFTLYDAFKVTMTVIRNHQSIQPEIYGLVSYPNKKNKS